MGNDPSGMLSAILAHIDVRFRPDAEIAIILVLAGAAVSAALNPILEFLHRIWLFSKWLGRSFKSGVRRLFGAAPPPALQPQPTRVIPEERTIWELRAPGAPTFPNNNGIPIITVDHDDMSISDFLRRLSGETAKQGRSSAPVANADTKEIVSRLKSALPSDDAFHSAMDRLAAQKSVTKPVLTQIYYDLFERTQGVPKKAPRADLLRLIEDERNIIVRNQKMGNMLGRRVVPAE